MSNMTVLVDLRSEFGPVRDQGPRPTCLAFAASDTHAAQRSGWQPMSCEYAFYHAQKRSGSPPHRGSRLPSMLNVLRYDGQPDEQGWPYLPTNPQDAASWQPPTDVGELFRRNSVQLSAHVDALVQSMNQGNAAIVLLTLSRSFFMPDAQALVHPAPGEVADRAQRHAVIAVGHGTSGAERFVLVRNSWGTRWGSDGHAWLSETFLSSRLFAAASLTENVDVPSHSTPA